jgi:photosystem II stability/assembly factor-like uncharacterized protein
MYENGNWTSLPSLPAGTYTDIFFLDDQTGWVCGSVLGKTLNGTTWQKCPTYPALQGDLIKLFFLDASNGWGVGAAGQILQTSDSGDTWFFTAVGMVSEFLINVQFTSLTNGYICGNDKILLKYGAISGVEETGGRRDREWDVKVWPNPCRNIVNCQLSIVDCQFFEIEIIDLIGSVVERGRGEGETSIDVSELPGGIYFVRLDFDNKLIVKKIIKL